MQLLRRPLQFLIVLFVRQALQTNRFFFGLKRRDGARALAGLLVAPFLWSTGAWARVQGGWDAWRQLEADALAQKATLAKEREVRNATALAVQGLDSGHGYDQAKLCPLNTSDASDE